MHISKEHFQLRYIIKSKLRKIWNSKNTITKGISNIIHPSLKPHNYLLVNKDIWGPVSKLQNIFMKPSTLRSTKQWNCHLSLRFWEIYRSTPFRPGRGLWFMGSFHSTVIYPMTTLCHAGHVTFKWTASMTHSQDFHIAWFNNDKK